MKAEAILKSFLILSEPVYGFLIPLCICMHVCMCVYVYIYIYIYTHTYMHIYICVCVCVYIKYGFESLNFPKRSPSHHPLMSLNGLFYASTCVLLP